MKWINARSAIVLAFLTLAGASAMPAEAGRARIRDRGVSPGIFPTGALNAITDVKGVRVGHVTLIEGQHVRTGVTAIAPHAGNVFQEKVAAGVHVGNGFGKAAGFLQVQELGTLETPIVLTNTLSVGSAIEGVVRWTLHQPGNEEVRSVNAVVGETNDGHLNDIRGMRVERAHVARAIETAAGGAVEEGSVGTGTGTMTMGWKGGIGTSSRRLASSLGGWTVGALVQTNYGGVLTIDGVRVGVALGRFSFSEQVGETRGAGRGEGGGGGDQNDAGRARDGSCMIVIATDAPLDAPSLERVAKRAMLGLARTGSFMSNGSGDFAIAFSTTNRIAHRSAKRVRAQEVVRDDRLSPIFAATVEAVEEAVYNALAAAETVEGRDGRVGEAIPLDRLRDLMERRR